MLDGKRNFIAESFLRHTYMKIGIGAKNIHRALLVLARGGWTG